MALTTDAYAQGVELTRQEQFDAGPVKIWSGNPGHVLIKNGFGMPSDMYEDVVTFNDRGLLDPVEYVKENKNIPTQQQFHIIDGNDRVESISYDGVIEPLRIRRPISSFSSTAPQFPNVFSMSNMGGNVDVENGSDAVLSVDYYDVVKNFHIPSYTDRVDVAQFVNNTRSNVKFSTTKISPFIDVIYSRNVHDENVDASVENALGQMSPSTDNYVSYEQRSGCCGWTFDGNTTIGTDSIAFGGRTY